MQAGNENKAKPKFDTKLKEEIQIENRRYRESVSRLEAGIPYPEFGYLGPNSISWKIYREPIVVLGGMRAVLMQTAHPAIAQGVEDNSNFRNNLFTRGRRTVQALYNLVFGDLIQARGMSTKVFNVHHYVRGMVSDETDSTWAGKPYRANDPELLLWVAATVAETTLSLYETLFVPLDDYEREQFINELKAGLTLNGVPSSYHFQSIEELKQYIDEKLKGPEIAVGEIGLGIAETLFTSRLTPTRFDERFTVGLLPPKIRDLYQLSWSPEKQANHEASLYRLRKGIHMIPGRLRYVPAYHQAMVRSNRVTGDSLSKYGRVLSWVDRKFYVPLGLHEKA